MSDSPVTPRAITLITAILCGIGIWLVFQKASQKADDKLNKVMKLLETVETNLDKSVAELPKKSPKKDDANEALAMERDDEIIRLRRELSKLQKQAEDQRSKFLLVEKGNTREVTALEYNLSQIQEKNEQAMRKVRTEKDRKIRKLEDENRRLEQTKAIAIPPLIDSLDHSDVEVRTAAGQALTTLTGMTLGTDQEKWRRWWRRNRSGFIRSR